MSQRAFFCLVLAFALVFASSAAQLHVLSHAQADLAAASSHSAPDRKSPSPLKHSTDQCLVFHDLDGTPGDAGGLFVTADLSHRVARIAAERHGESPCAAYDSRAPPFLS